MVRIAEPRVSHRHVVIIAVVVAVRARQRLHQREILAIGFECLLVLPLREPDVALALPAVPQQLLPGRTLRILVDEMSGDLLERLVFGERPRAVAFGALGIAHAAMRRHQPPAPVGAARPLLRQPQIDIEDRPIARERAVHIALRQQDVADPG